MKEKIEDPRKLEVMGVNIDIAYILGDKILDQYLAGLSEDDMKKIMQFVDKSLFNVNYNNEHTSVKTNNGGWGSKELLDYVKEDFNTKYKEELLKRLNEKLQTDEYQEKIANAITEVIDYAIDGWKADLITCIKKQMIHNFFNESSTESDIKNALMNFEYEKINPIRQQLNDIRR